MSSTAPVSSVAPAPSPADIVGTRRALVTGATSGIGRAEAIAFLATDRGSDITGATIAVDGVRTAI